MNNTSTIYETTILDNNDSTNPEENIDFCKGVLPYQISSLTFTFVAVIYLLYIITALCIYGYKKKLMVGCGDTSMLPRNRATSIVNSMTVCSALSTFVYIVIETPLIAPPVPHFCNVYHRVKISSFAVSLICSYFALWYRVYTLFYRHPVMKKSMSKLIKFITFLPLILLLFMVISNLVVFLSAPAYQNVKCGCHAVQEQKKNSVKWAMLVVGTTTFQATLLFSFIYPLYLHRKKMLSRGFDHQQIIPVIKRATVVAVVCVVSDLFNSGFAIFYKGGTVYLNHIVISTNLLVNLMGVIMSFANWRKKLFPFRKSKHYVVKGQTVNSKTSSNLNTIKITGSTST